MLINCKPDMSLFQSGFQQYAPLIGFFITCCYIMFNSNNKKINSSVFLPVLFLSPFLPETLRAIPHVFYSHPVRNSI